MKTLIIILSIHIFSVQTKLLYLLNGGESYVVNRYPTNCEFKKQMIKAERSFIIKEREQKLNSKG